MMHRELDRYIGLSYGGGGVVMCLELLLRAEGSERGRVVRETYREMDDGAVRAWLEGECGER